MRFGLLPIAVLIASVAADGAAIVAALEKITSATIALNDTVASFPTGILGVVDTVKLLADSVTLLQDINDGTTVAEASANLTLSETISVAESTIALVADVESTLTTIIAAKPKFDALLLVSPVILLNLKLEKDATDKFSAAVISKVPTDLQAYAEIIVAPVDTAFDAAITAYE